VTTPLREGQWTNQPAYLVGGGPSLRTFDWSLLIERQNVIVINMAYWKVPSAAIWFSEDYRVIDLALEDCVSCERRAEHWRDFQGVKLLHALDPAFADHARKKDADIHILERTRQDKFWARSFTDGLSCSSNSMIGALNLADILGADPIYLFGVDCNTPKDGERFMQNFHTCYPAGWKVAAGQLKDFESDFRLWAAPHLTHRRIVNVNQDSAVSCWPKMSVENVFSNHN